MFITQTLSQTQLTANPSRSHNPKIQQWHQETTYYLTSQGSLASRDNLGFD
jgi:hypothetical protein